jgi:hypothetical protein
VGVGVGVGVGELRENGGWGAGRDCACFLAI